MIKVIVKKIRGLNKLIIGFSQILYAEVIYFTLGQQGLSNYIRKVQEPSYILKHFGVLIGRGTIIYPGITINCRNRSELKKLKIGSEVRILWDVIIDINDDVIIEDFAHIGARSMLITHFNLAKSPLGIREYPYESGRIKIGKGSVISWGSMILHDSEIGSHTIISGGSTIKGDVPSFCIFGGNPGRPIKKINPQNMDDFREDSV